MSFRLCGPELLAGTITHRENCDGKNWMQGQIVKATQEWASLITNLQWQKVMQVVPRWLAFVLAVLVAKSAADLTWLVFAPSSQQGGGFHRLRAIPSSTPAPVRLRTISELHLFGIAAKHTSAPQVPIEAKETHLKLTLRGVFAANNPAQAMAIIADARGKEKVYRKGETIFSGVKLYAVYPDRVILERSGNFETLSLPRDKDHMAAKGVRVIRPRRYTSSYGANGSLPVVTRTVQGGRALKTLRNQILHNPQVFWQNVRIEPRYGRNNQIVGYTFRYNDRRMMQAMGLRPGDVIVAVNGQSVSDPSVLRGLMSQLSTATHFTLGIERNGQRQNLDINM
jgi:general secretion pathway protein C